MECVMAKNSSKAPPAATDKVKNGPAPVADTSLAPAGDTQSEPPQDDEADPSVTAAPPPVEGEVPEGAPPAVAADDEGDDDDTTPPPELAEPGETVPALVLSDNHLGKVGQVVQVPAGHAEQLRLGGLIDTHPNAIPKEG